MNIYFSDVTTKIQSFFQQIQMNYQLRLLIVLTSACLPNVLPDSCGDGTSFQNYIYNERRSQNKHGQINHPPSGLLNNKFP